MKKWTALFLSLLVILGCTAAAAGEGTEEATILADKVPAVVELLARGDTVNVVGEFDEDHYVIEREAGFGLVEKMLLSMADAPAYEAWTGYSRNNRNLYDNYHLWGEPVQVLGTNVKVEVLDELDGCCVVKWDDVTGFMKMDDISRYPIQSGGGGGAPAGGNDGGEISLSRSEGIITGGIVLLNGITWEATVTGEATVKADGAEVVLCYFDREDTVQILPEPDEEWEGYVTVLVDGSYAHVKSALLLPEGEEPYEAWDGYAKKDARLYDNFCLRGEGETLNTNTAVHVVADLEICYLVTVKGEFGYMAKDLVSPTQTATYSAPAGGGGQEWSDPVL